MSAPERASCCLLAACGLPGAGKSTLCAALAAHVQQGGHADCVCVSFDALEREFAAPGGAFDAERWKLARAEALAQVDAHLARARSGGVPLLLLADDTAHLTSMRRDLFLLARNRGAAYAQLYVHAPPELAAARNAGRAGAERVPDAVFARMAAAFEPPDVSTHAFEQPTLRVDAADDAADVADVWRRVHAAWGAAPQLPLAQDELDARRAAGETGNAASSVHAWDVCARRALSEIIAQAPPAQRARLAAQLNDCRRQHLQRLQAAQAADCAPPLGALRAEFAALAAAAASGEAAEEHAFASL